MRALGIGTVILALLATSGGVIAAQDEASTAPTPSLEMQTIQGRHTATLLADGTVLLVGGTGEGPVAGAAAEIYDPATRSFSPVGSLQFPRSWHTATRLADGRVLILGGASEAPGDGASVAEAEIYDPLTQRFSPAGRLRAPRQQHSAILLDDGRVLVIGGMDFTGVDLRVDPGPHTVAAIEVYDPATQRSTKIGRLRKGRWDHDAFLLPDGRVLVVGLVVKGDPYRFDSRVVIDRFDPATGTVSSRLNAQGTDLTRRTGVSLADGRVLLVGGYRPAVLFDPDTSRFRETARTTTAESGQTVTLLDDGRVLVLGGEELGPATVELFDPASETFERVGELHSARRGHAATKLTDGTVLLTGGYGYEDALGNAEIFDPASLDVVAYGPVPAAEAAAPTPTPTPVLAPLGSLRGGGVVELPGSGFRIRFPEDWSVEVLDPDRDYRTAAAGDTWTALRAHDPDRLEACSVDVGVAVEGANGLELDVDTDESTAQPYWRGRGKLMLPRPQVEIVSDTLEGVMGGFDRRASADPGIEHDVLYGLSCLSSSGRMPDAAFKRFKVLPADSGGGGVEPTKPEPIEPPSPRPLPRLGGTVPGGRVERTGSGFAITLPRRWVVRVAEPDPDITTAAPGSTWEALRAYQPGRRAACSVYVGVAPADAPSVGDGGDADLDTDATRPYWSGSVQPVLVVPSPRFRSRSPPGASGIGVSGRSRLRADDPRLPHDVVYAVACGFDGERGPGDIPDSLEILGGGPATPG